MGDFVKWLGLQLNKISLLFISIQNLYLPNFTLASGPGEFWSTTEEWSAIRIFYRSNYFDFIYLFLFEQLQIRWLAQMFYSDQKLEVQSIKKWLSSNCYLIISSVLAFYLALSCWWSPSCERCDDRLIFALVGILGGCFWLQGGRFRLLNVSSRVTAKWNIFMHVSCLRFNRNLELAQRGKRFRHGILYRHPEGNQIFKILENYAWCCMSWLCVFLPECLVVFFLFFLLTMF